METMGRTRMNLLLLRRRVEGAQRGLELLRSKREALVREFFAVMDRVAESRHQMETVLGQALTTLNLGLGLEGRASLRSAGYAARRTLSIELTERNVWGVRFPEVCYAPVLRGLNARGYASSGVSTHIDETARHFEQVLELILRSVSIELRLKKLGNEIKKVTGRINALNDAIIPALTREAWEIGQTLEEREREEWFRMKRFKQNVKGRENE